MGIIDKNIKPQIIKGNIDKEACINQPSFWYHLNILGLGWYANIFVRFQVFDPQHWLIGQRVITIIFDYKLAILVDIFRKTNFPNEIQC